MLVDPPPLDLRVKLIFDEDLNTLVFPLVKELLIRVNSDSPLELAAKALATRNRHPHLWQTYVFSVARQTDVEINEEVVEDLRKSFGRMKERLEQTEIVMFYKIRGEYESEFRTGKEEEEEMMQQMAAG